MYLSFMRDFARSFVELRISKPPLDFVMYPKNAQFSDLDASHIVQLL
jgi:hypothetical protein